VLAAREWGGAATGKWVGFSAPADLKALPDAQLDQLRPLYQAMLEGQGGTLLEHLKVAR
jgi:hypothetical protein